MESHERLVVALDVDNPDTAKALVHALRGRVGVFKVGLELFTLGGPGLVREIVSAGGKVFLDLKLHDIPNTVARAAVQVARLGVRMLTVHAQGGSAMIAAAAEAVRGEAARLGTPAPSVLAVTVLTSLGPDDLRSMGAGDSPEKAVLRLAALAREAGADGVVASPREVVALRERLGRDLLVVTPGVRPEGEDRGDQKRTMTPAEAIAAGADYIVLGRPVIRADDPAARASAIAASLNGGGLGA
jgi:orotidine-5'-phosphate decarboxylase